MRNRNRPGHHERHVECIHKLFARHAAASALFKVISDAVVATQHNRTDQAHQFLRLLIERAVFISLRVQREESLDAEMATAQKLLIHFSAITIKIVHQIEPSKNRYVSTECTIASPCAL